MDQIAPRIRLMSTFGTPKLGLIMSALFVCLSIPILIFILLYNYQKNSATIASTLEQSVNKTIQGNIESAGSWVEVTPLAMVPDLVWVPTVTHDVPFHFWTV